ncbi:spermatogenesis-associated protein 4 isoform X1 [Xyrichtys novacula]|uniref:Spermatogenesis-associated protein 4 n=1 Tax=Xyrichtys novacula TaxID=13765 RepID=A0AAV1FDF7_XYRNO|nr:spermatogenesis-associated protein 4 isoform X1 [Xyrichtys novacula]
MSSVQRKPGLPREVLKWLQSLRLSSDLRNVRRDFSNGYLVAEIFSCYYPQDFPVHSFDKGTSLSAKQGNWSQIERTLQRKNLHLMKEVIDGTIHCKPGAAELLVREIYTILTNRSIRSVQGPDSSDRGHQDHLPSAVRSTASQTIKNNLRTSEIMADPDITTNQRKAEVILHRHLRHQAAERVHNPGRLKVKPNLGYLAAKSPFPPSSSDGHHDRRSSGDSTSKSCVSPTWSGAVVPFKEIKVLQPVRRSLVN